MFFNLHHVKILRWLASSVSIFHIFKFLPICYSDYISFLTCCTLGSKLICPLYLVVPLDSYILVALGPSVLSPKIRNTVREVFPSCLVSCKDREHPSVSSPLDRKHLRILSFRIRNSLVMFLPPVLSSQIRSSL